LTDASHLLLTNPILLLQLVTTAGDLFPRPHPLTRTCHAVRSSSLRTHHHAWTSSLCSAFRVFGLLSFIPPSTTLHATSTLSCTRSLPCVDIFISVSPRCRRTPSLDAHIDRYQNHHHQNITDHINSSHHYFRNRSPTSTLIIPPSSGTSSPPLCSLKLSYFRHTFTMAPCLLVSCLDSCLVCCFETSCLLVETALCRMTGKSLAKSPVDVRRECWLRVHSHLMVNLRSASRSVVFK